MGWLAASHLTIITLYAVFGYVHVMATGSEPTHVVGYIAGLITLLAIAFWHWWEGLYN